MDHHQYRQALQASMAGSERYLPSSEFVHRHQRLNAVMAEQGLDALLVTNPAEIHYLTGYSTFEVSVHCALVYRADRCLLQVPSIETGPAVTTAQVDEITGYRWEAIETVTAPLLEALGGSQRVGYDPWGAALRPGLISALQSGLGAQRFVDAGGLLNDLRLVKSEAELDCLRKSAAMTEAGMAAALQSVAPGVSENDIAAAGASAMLKAGSEFMSLQPIVVSGPRSSVIHLNHQQRQVKQGDPVFIEFGAVFRRYTAPQMKTAIAGVAPSPAMLHLRDHCLAIYEALTMTMVPGNTFDEAAQRAEAAFAPVAEQAFFSGVFGYSVGATFPPSWVEGTGYIARGETRQFQENMVFHLPICLRIPGQWGIGLSNTVVVGPNGAQPLTQNDWQLNVCA